MDTEVTPISPVRNSQFGRVDNRGKRLAVAVLVGVVTALVTYVLRPARADLLITDFDQTWLAARLLRAHENPYALIGPGLAFPWGWRYYYPLPAAVLALPLSFLTVSLANATFTGVSGGLLAFGVTRDGFARLPMFISAAYFHAIWIVQWSPLLTAALVIPAIGFALPAKPTIGGALFLTRPRWSALFGGVVIVALSVAIQPRWPLEWYDIVRSGLHHRPPILLTGGWIVSLALLRWRRYDARLLLLLACVPQTIDVFEALPLFLIPDTFRESTILATTTTISYLLFMAGPSQPSLAAQAQSFGWLFIAGCYVPALVMILRRPNASTRPAWAE